MSARYEFWLTNDRGQRVYLVKDFSWVSYTRAVSSLGTVNFGMPFSIFAEKLNPWFVVDWRLDVWRSPAHGLPLRREDTFMLRKPEVYTRSQDGMQIIRFYGRNGIDLLHRRTVVQRNGTTWANKSGAADDVMKEMVREQMLWGSAVDEDGTQDNARAWPQDEFNVQADAGLGPTVTRALSGKQVSDALKEIKEATFQLNASDASQERIFFDVRPMEIGNGRLGWRFETRAGLYGADRTLQTIFSEQNENILGPTYSESHLDEVNVVYVAGNGQGNTQIIESVQDSVRLKSSRWNRSEKWASASAETGTDGLQAAGYAELEKGKPSIDMPLTFLNTPGEKSAPRSLYGVDWDLGDRLRVSYAARQFEVEVNVVYVSVDENGSEQVTGRNEVLA